MPSVTALRSCQATLLLVSIALLFSSCAGRIAFVPSQAAPSAQGTIRLSKDRNNNYLMDVTVKHLPDPNQLQPSRSLYMVWMDTETNGIQNLSQLRVSGAGNGWLQTTSPYRPFRIFITAEDNPSLPYPGSQQIISTLRL